MKIFVKTYNKDLDRFGTMYVEASELMDQKLLPNLVVAAIVKVSASDTIEHVRLFNFT